MIWDKTRAKANTIIMMDVMPILTLVFVLIDAELYVILAMVGLILLNAGLSSDIPTITITDCKIFPDTAAQD